MDIHHTLILSILKKKELSEIYAMMSLRTMAMSLINIFVPIYLYVLGYGIPAILLFVVTKSATHALLCPASAKISSKIGFKHGMLFGFLGYFIYFIMLTMLGNNAHLLYPSAIVYGASQALFWVPFHALLAVATDGKKRGEEVALLEIFPAIFSIFAPLIGGLIVFFMGFDTLFIVGLAFLMAAALPLFASKEIRMPFKFSGHVEGFDKKVAASLISYSDEVNETLWPIFIFIVVGSAAVIGGIVAFSVLIGFVTIWVIGRMCDKGYRKKILRFGSLGQCVLWGFRALATSFIHIVSLESVWRLISKFKEVPYSAAYYEKAKRTRQRLEFSVLREMTIHTSIVIVFASLYLLYSYIPDITVIFFIAAFGALFSIFIEK